ncbi:hypothetical protein [Streptomyces canus]|uniref:Uncharacterized protein n=1 Tax=Streptomyces canus TaxID=58343 RepID=A0AAW8FGJ4_9ACTN|nr:hypothetical protein [Streptomyces canus]MDQ0762669.1 hypothetical protein [Streptomyces canus]MDQ0908859.1 hypothetical protein [Streptomyces canus]MDQ1068888.1 hypothetical protein [Streptomyces canus]
MAENQAAAAAASEQKPVEPRGGAGVFDVDPDQSGVSQDPKKVVKGDISVFPENTEV